jgi:hypothetical protein
MALNPSEKLQQVISTRRVSVVAASGIAGVGINALNDLLSHEEDFWILLIGQYIRICLLVGAQPDSMLPSDAYVPTGNAASAELAYGLDLSAQLLLLCGELDQAEDAIGWESATLRDFLTDDNRLMEMPMECLNDICRHTNLGISDAMATLWRLVGK